jgi:outer membrane receptor protein involved in Fe transport
LFFEGASSIDVAGRQLPLSPYVLASMGLLYTPREGFASSVVVRYVGRRFLDVENIAPVGGYALFDATLGYGFNRYRIALEGTNLTNQRAPVSASEFGSQSFHLLPPRSIWLRLGYNWR